MGAVHAYSIVGSVDASGCGGDASIRPVAQSPRATGSCIFDGDRCSMRQDAWSIIIQRRGVVREEGDLVLKMCFRAPNNYTVAIVRLVHVVTSMSRRM